MQNEDFKQPDTNVSLFEQIADVAEEPAAPPTPNRPPWNILIALGVWVMSILFILIFPTIFTVPYFINKGVDLADTKVVAEIASTDPIAIFLQILAVIPAHVATLLLAWLVVTGFKKYSFRQTLGWDWGGFKIWHAFVISFLFYGVMFVAGEVLGRQEREFDRMLQSSRATVYLVAFFATFTAPLVEEVIYRGILFSALQDPKKILFPQIAVLRRIQEFYARHSTVLAVLLVTFLFAVIHAPQYSNKGMIDYATIIPLLLLSLTLTLIRVKTGNLLPCIVLHTVFNGIQALLLVIQALVGFEAPKPPEAPAFVLYFLQ